MTYAAAYELDPMRDRAFSLGAGRLDPAVTSALRASEHGKHRLLLEGVRRTTYELRLPTREIIRRGHELLTETERRAPQVVADVLMLPQVGGWAAECLSASTEELESDRGSALLGYMCALAVTAALRASVAFDLSIPAGHRSVSLPGLGRLSVPNTKPGQWVRLRSDDAGTLVGDHDGTSIVARPLERRADPAWTPIPRLRVRAEGLTLDVLLDTDEHLASRFGSPAPAAAQVAFQHWSSMIEDAWRILSTRHRAVAEEIAAGLRSLVPLPFDDGRGPRSATSGWLWGAIALGLPRDPWDLAEILVHEYHHLLLGAFEDTAPLVISTDRRLHYAPWRDDPRPSSGLMHGTYANIAMAAFWRSEAARIPDDTDRLRPNVEFAWRRTVTMDALRDLGASDALTTTGRAFLDGLNAHWRRLSQVTVSPQAEAWARELTTEHRLRWRLAHAEPESSAIDAIASAWVSGEPPSAGLRWPTVRVVGRQSLGSELHSTLRARANVRSTLARRLRPENGLRPAEVALLRNDDAEARRLCLAEIAAGGALYAWVTLGLCILRMDEGGTHSPILARPEVVVALHGQIRQVSGSPPAPEALARWLLETVGGEI